MIGAVWGLLSSRIGPYVMGAAALAGVLAGFVMWLHHRDTARETALRAALAAEQAATVAQVQAADRRRADAAVAAAVRGERDAAARLARNMKANHDGPVSTACVSSPATRAYLDRVRHDAVGSGNGAPGNPGGAAVVQPGR
jgi:hypothetical protein